MTANEMKEKNGMRRGSSILHPELKVDKISQEMIEHVLQEEIFKPPYMSWISIGQILWGGGVHWKKAAGHLSLGIYKHSGINKPGQADLDFWYRRFGYYPEWPEPSSRNLVMNSMKKKFINKKAKGEGFDDIEFLYGKGYIDPSTGKLSPKHTTGIVGWFIMHKNPEYRQEQITWLENQKKYIIWQYALCCRTFQSTIYQQIESGRAKTITNQYLLDQTVYKEIENVLENKCLLPSAEELKNE